jgi:4-hydroxybenzoate polyprenyltransferase
MTRGGGGWRALVASSHPGPVVAVTAVATLLAVAAGAGSRSLLVLLAFLAGQLSIGWCNDWLDAARDAAVGRRDKPVAVGVVDPGTVRLAAAVAAVATVVVSFGLGWRAGVTHSVAVAVGWAYNAGLKATVWSWAPYALFFGLLPVVVLLALPGHPWPPAWMVTAGGLLGVGAHLVNVLPDLEDDRSTGVRGLPHLLGRTRAGVLAPAVLVLASALVIVGPRGTVGAGGWLALVVVGVLAAVAALAAAAGRRQLPLLATAAIAIVDVALLVASGETLSG